jgi:hypothetical protein
MPLFVFDDKLDDMGVVIGSDKHVSVGLRYAAGVELKINGHLSVQGDLGGEYFRQGHQHAGKTFESSVFVPGRRDRPAMTRAVDNCEAHDVIVSLCSPARLGRDRRRRRRGRTLTRRIEVVAILNVLVLEAQVPLGRTGTLQFKNNGSGGAATITSFSPASCGTITATPAMGFPIMLPPGGMATVNVTCPPEPVGMTRCLFHAQDAAHADVVDFMVVCESYMTNNLSAMPTTLAFPPTTVGAESSCHCSWSTTARSTFLRWRCSSTTSTATSRSACRATRTRCSAIRAGSRFQTARRRTSPSSASRESPGR